mmetsp:Transcript_5537/g.12369  ORF Transcript_5537/g.12369 Transcript_5537/m.12369 type:complete len:1160 (+) Transcript_5537:156-3635(+)
MSIHKYTAIDTRDGEMKAMDIEGAQQPPSAAGEKSHRYLIVFVGLVTVAVLSLFGSIFMGPGQATPLVAGEGAFDSNGRYVMKNFDVAKPMSDFLNGLGGVWGVPMWAFFINRGQAIASFGTQNKDGSIMKFNTAEKAYQQAPFTGFRTFVKGHRAVGKHVAKTFQHQPFFPRTSYGASGLQRNLMIGENEMEIEEVAQDLGLQTNVLYFTVPNEDYPSLVRRVTFTNLDPTEPLQLEVLDGLAKLEPAGLSNAGLDAMGRTLEAYMKVYNVGAAGGGRVKEPFFHASQSTADTAQVQLIKDGQFVVSFQEDVEDEDGLLPALGIIVDPSVVFDTDTTMLSPQAFFADNAPGVHDLLEQEQGTSSRTPCAFAGTQVIIPGGKSVTITSIYGHADNLEQFVGTISPQVRKPGYVDTKRKEAADLVSEITAKVVTKTNSRVFDDYIKQDYLDNVLRGGLPMPLGDSEDPKIFHTFSRIHGDIERDYNNFQIDTTYYSQGPGNFRDVSQNRRLDVQLNPTVGDFNVRMFSSFVQYDGYNPLTVASTLFTIPAESLGSLVASLGVVTSAGVTGTVEAVMTSLSKPFRPGQFFLEMKTAGVKFGLLREQILQKITAVAEQSFAAQFNQNGFWTDHWTYTLDLFTDYLTVFPDKLEHLFYDASPVPFFMSPAYVLPRTARYTLVDDPKNPGKKTVRVYKPLNVITDEDFDPKLAAEMLGVWAGVADQYGAGALWMRDSKANTFKVPVGTKMLMLGVLKMSSMDPYGMGVEMEGGKPGWNDAMNGLPGIMGSGMPETYEMLKILQFCSDTVKAVRRDVSVPVEFGTFLESMGAALEVFGASAKDTKAEFAYWDASNVAREAYRASVRATFDGEMSSIPTSDLLQLLAAMESKVAHGIAKALLTNDGYSPTYFSYECTEYVHDEKSGDLTALAFKQHYLPLFLEGPTRHMKVVDMEERRDIYKRTRDSDLYDSALQMYTLSASLKSIGPDVGRMVAFSPGWLENESVWLHMSYKFYLELLRGGLYEEFFAEIATGMCAFMDPQVYGRSPLEACSFIVSSAFPDKKLHGQGFMARLSGSTAEFLTMWGLMFAGPAPFSLDRKGALQLAFSPALPGWLFPQDGQVSFAFLGSVTVTYVNPTQEDTWRIQPVFVTLLGADGSFERVEVSV